MDLTLLCKMICSLLYRLDLVQSINTNYLREKMISKEYPTLWQFMIIGDLMAIFVILACISSSIYYILRKYRPRLCYYNDKFDLFQIRNYLNSKLKKKDKRHSWKRRTVSFVDSVKQDSNAEPIYEDININPPELVLSNPPKRIDYLRYESYAT